MKNEAMEARVEEMADQELYRFLIFDRFDADPGKVREVCQEIERREAARAGREPAIVQFKEMNAYGYSSGGQIGLTTDFLEADPTEPAAKILNTLLHEGRHEWQNHIHLKRGLYSSEKDNLVYLVESKCYCNGEMNVVDLGLPWKIQAFIQYSMQENEMDARFYAIRRMREISEACNSDDPLKQELEKEISKAIGVELAYIGNVIGLLGNDEYKLLEKAKLEMFRRQCPTIHVPDGFKCYDNIGMILNVVKPAYEHLLERIMLTGERILEQEKLMYKLYEAARIRKMEGKPLEQPIELELMAVSGELGELLVFEEQPLSTEEAEKLITPEKAEKTIALEYRSRAIGL